MAMTTSERIRRQRRVAQLASDRRTGASSRREVSELKRQWLAAHWRGLLPGLVFFAAVGVCLHRYLWRPAAPYVIGALAASCAWGIYVVMLETGGFAHKRSGIAAEEWTSLELRRLRRHGWFVVNHVMRQHTDIDHALLGPGGFFAIETKFRSDWSTAKLHLNSMTGQARQNAWDLDGPLGPSAERVQPIVVPWGPGAATVFDHVFEEDGVVFCPGHLLHDYLVSLPARMRADDVETAYATLDAYILRRDQDEIAKDGDLPRPVSDSFVDFSVIGMALIGATLAILGSVPLGPEGLSSVVVALALAATAAVARRRWRRHVRIQRLTTAIVTVAAGLGTLIAVAALLD